MRRLTARILATSALLLLVACQPASTQLEEIQQRGVLKIVTRNSPTTFYVGSDGFTGYEYDIVNRFAEELGVRVELIAEDDIAGLLEMVESGEVDFASAGLSITPAREDTFRFGPPYQDISAKVVYRQGEVRPRNFEQIDGNLVLVANSSHAEALRKVREDYPELRWQETDNATVEELLNQVLDGEIDYTIADSNELALIRPFQPELAIAFTVGEPEQLAWVFSKETDDSLYAAAIEFFGEIQNDGSLEYLTDRYYGHIGKFDYVGSRVFLQQADSLLPKFEATFREAAGDDVDWRLLAAMGYQESQWKPDARSPTGVRGLMMLTQNTAKQMGVTNRLDPEQSIRGGADYFRRVLKKIPERIESPDRVWFALASYNVGFGHLEDARRLTEQAGDDPDLWTDVKKYLPLLRQKKWYSRTRYGYARGDEPVHYVNNIRRYYDVLVWLDEQNPEAIADSTESSEEVARPR